MSEAKALKLREYGTNVISHDLAYANNSEVASQKSLATRFTDTFKSKVLD